MELLADVSNQISQGEPAFISGDGEIFDSSYLPLNMVVAKQPNEQRGIYIDPYPDASKYETFFDYEEAMKEWKKHVDRVLGNAQLPSVAGRHYYRPFKPKSNNLRVCYYFSCKVLM